MSRINSFDRFKMQITALRTDFRARLCASRRDIRKVYGATAWNKAKALATRIVEELSHGGLRKDTHALLVSYGLTRSDINVMVASTTKRSNSKEDVVIAGIVPAFRTVLKVVTCCGYSSKRGLYGWFADCGESRSGIDVHLVAEWRYQNQF